MHKWATGNPTSACSVDQITKEISCFLNCIIPLSPSLCLLRDQSIWDQHNKAKHNSAITKIIMLTKWNQRNSINITHKYHTIMVQLSVFIKNITTIYLIMTPLIMYIHQEITAQELTIGRSQNQSKYTRTLENVIVQK